MALSCMVGSMWEYVSRVMEMLECPSISETTFGFTLRESSRVAQVCLKSWKRTFGMSDEEKLPTTAAFTRTFTPPSRLKRMSN